MITLVVCPCGLVRTESGWTRPAVLPPPPHSHGICPACVAKYRREMEALKEALKEASK